MYIQNTLTYWSCTSLYTSRMWAPLWPWYWVKSSNAMHSILAAVNKNFQHRLIIYELIISGKGYHFLWNTGIMKIRKYFGNIFDPTFGRSKRLWYLFLGVISLTALPVTAVPKWGFVIQVRHGFSCKKIGWCNIGPRK